MARALIVKLGAIGDVVMAIPAAAALHRAGFAVDWVCGKAVAPLLGLYPWIDRIVVDEESLARGGTGARLQAVLGVWRTLAGREYDLAATLYYDSRYRVLTLPIRARRRIMLSQTDRASRLLPGRHHTDEYARILLGVDDGERPEGLAPAAPPGMPPSPLERTVSAHGQRTRVVLAPGGARNLLRDDALRRWPVESYAAVARELVTRGVEVVLTGSNGDAWASAAFAGVGVVDCIGAYSLLETLGLLDGADVFLTHDTGPLHLAGLTSVGLVAIFGPTDPAGRLPRRPGAEALWGGAGFACRPCYDGRDYAPCAHNGCVREITPALAIERIMRMLAQRASVPAVTDRLETVTR